MKYFSVVLLVLLCVVPFASAQCDTDKHQTCTLCIADTACQWCAPSGIATGVSKELFIGRCAVKDAACESFYSSLTPLFPFTSTALGTFAKKMELSITAVTAAAECPETTADLKSILEPKKSSQTCEECVEDPKFHWCQIDAHHGDRINFHFFSSGGICLADVADININKCYDLFIMLYANYMTTYGKNNEYKPCPAADTCDGQDCETCTIKKRCVWCSQRIERTTTDGTMTPQGTVLGTCKPLPTFAEPNPCAAVKFGTFGDVHSYTYEGTENVAKVVAYGPGEWETCNATVVPETATTLNTCADCIKGNNKWCLLDKKDDKGVCAGKAVCDKLSQEEETSVQVKITSSLIDKCTTTSKKSSNKKSSALRTVIGSGVIVATLLATSVYF